jgi:hypothetical protein
MLKKAASGVPCLRRSGYAQAGRHFAVLTYSMYAPRVKMAAAFPSTPSGQDWTDFFEHSLQLMMAVSSWACICHGNEIFNSPIFEIFIERGTVRDMNKQSVITTLQTHQKELQGLGVEHLALFGSVASVCEKTPFFWACSGRFSWLLSPPSHLVLTHGSFRPPFTPERG